MLDPSPQREASFFRDPEVFASIGARLFPQLLEHTDEAAPVRVWVAGCSSGEAVYSLAITWLEFLGRSQKTQPIRIFGSDASEVAVAKARAGVYGEIALHGVSTEQRERYFHKVVEARGSAREHSNEARGSAREHSNEARGSAREPPSEHYRINKDVRQLCVFARHDLVRDPPFSRMDLISCRNVLISFDQALQKKLLSTLHYCLNQPGFLVLGRSESIGGLSRLFSTVDKANKLFGRTSAPSRVRVARRVDVVTLAEPADRAGIAHPERADSLSKPLDGFAPGSGTSNEELISGNEELQRMNEELESAKEELQSINDELVMLNDELERRNHEVERLAASSEQARVEADRANRAKDDFLAMLSHELRTPMSSILLNAQRLRSGELVERHDLQRAGEALERATHLQVGLIDDLLDVSRIAAGKLTLDLGLVKLCDVVRASTDHFAAAMAAKSLTLTSSVDTSLGPIWADPARVQQTVMNLLSNAIKFTPAGGRVTVAVDSVVGFARVSVSDNGIGIEADFLPRVFDRFSQSDGSIARRHGGLGLGLALARHLVELHGGTVHAASAGAGRGAQFSLTFPLALSSQLALAEPTSQLPEQALDRPGRTRQYAALSGLRVLFVDDDQRTREAVREVLQFTGAIIELAASAAEGAAAVETFKPDVILCDVAMPGEDGYTFIRKQRTREAGHGPAIPALALTALASDEDQRRALAAGFQRHLAKPIDIDRLREAVLELSTLRDGTDTKAAR